MSLLSFDKKKILMYLGIMIGVAAFLYFVKTAYMVAWVAAFGLGFVFFFLLTLAPRFEAGQVFCDTVSDACKKADSSMAKQVCPEGLRNADYSMNDFEYDDSFCVITDKDKNKRKVPLVRVKLLAKAAKRFRGAGFAAEMHAATVTMMPMMVMM